MPHFQVDDDLAFHAKAIAAGNAAMGLWVRAGSICTRQLTDGFVSSEIANALGTRAEIARLVKVDLWEIAEGGYQFHEWDFDYRTGLKRQEKAEDNLRRRRDRAARTAKWRAERDAAKAESRLRDVSQPRHRDTS
jgi:hypothetical protein